MNEGYRTMEDPVGFTDAFEKSKANQEFLESIYATAKKDPDWAVRIASEMKKERKIASLPRKERQREMTKLAERRERMRDPNEMSRREHDDALMRKYCGLK